MHAQMRVCSHAGARVFARAPTHVDTPYHTVLRSSTGPCGMPPCWHAYSKVKRVVAGSRVVDSSTLRGRDP